MYLQFPGKLLCIESNEWFTYTLKRLLYHTTMYISITRKTFKTIMIKWRKYGSNQQFLACIVSFTLSSSGNPGADREQCTISIFKKKGIE